tara:strand:- start:36 stop:464 length:429 start_codon:yes stop_codon:yes gene_type:complete
MEKKMAEITRTNGSAFGVVAHDRSTSGSGAISADEAVIANGPQLDFFKIIVKDVSGNVEDIRNELDAGEGVEAILNEIGKKANIEMYQVEGDTTGQISIAVFPSGAFTATTLQTAIRTLSAAGSNNLDATTSDVTNPGFELV